MIILNVDSLLQVVVLLVQNVKIILQLGDALLVDLQQAIVLLFILFPQCPLNSEKSGNRKYSLFVLNDLLFQFIHQNCHRVDTLLDLLLLFHVLLLLLLVLLDGLIQLAQILSRQFPAF